MDVGLKWDVIAIVCEYMVIVGGVHGLQMSTDSVKWRLVCCRCEWSV